MQKLKIGLAGLGTVGESVYNIVKKDAKFLSHHSQKEFEIIAATSRTKKDFLDSNIKFYDNVIDLASDPDVDVIVEVIGGTTVAKDLIVAAIKNGKKCVTANKALLAEHGAEIAQLVEKYNGYIGFEASTAGANPVIKTFKESFTAGEITEFYGILNGTCNFILTKMEQEGLGFEETLNQAQELGYAEADPTLDIKGIDTAHKLSILSSIAAIANPEFKDLHIEGVDEVTLNDIKLASDLGYRIKVLAIFKNLGDGKTQQTVYPTLVKKSEKIAQIDEAYNAVLVNTSNASWNLSVGRGAGGLTTASAVLADVVDIANDRLSPLFGSPCQDLQKTNLIDISQRIGQYFITLKIAKENIKEGDLSQIIFGNKIHIKQASFLDDQGQVNCAFLTESYQESEIIAAIDSLDSNIAQSAKFLRVENIGF